MPRRATRQPLPPVEELPPPHVLIAQIKRINREVDEHIAELERMLGEGFEPREPAAAAERAQPIEAPAPPAAPQHRQMAFLFDPAPPAPAPPDVVADVSRRVRASELSIDDGARLVIDDVRRSRGEPPLPPGRLLLTAAAGGGIDVVVESEDAPGLAWSASNPPRTSDGWPNPPPFCPFKNPVDAAMKSAGMRVAAGAISEAEAKELVLDALRPDRRKSPPRAARRASKKEPEMPMPATGRAKRLSPEALLVLDACTVEGNVVRIPPASSVPGLAPAFHAPQDRLARKLYEEVNAALAAIGGKWKGGKTQGHVFDSDPRQALEAVVVTGAFTNPRDAFAFFETPAELARRVVEAADIKPGMRVLEPSGGRGAIACPARAADGQVICVELDPKNVSTLRALFFDVIERDFLAVTAADLGGLVDRVVGNPPFSVPGLAHADVAHVTHAYELLKPGGRLVAIMGTGVTFRETRPFREFRAWTRMGEQVIEALRDRDASYGWGWGSGGIAGRIEKLPAGTFKASGTGVSTVLLILDKPGA